MNMVNLHNHSEANISYVWKGNNISSSVFYYLNFLRLYYDTSIKGHDVLES